MHGTGTLEPDRDRMPKQRPRTEQTLRLPSAGSLNGEVLRWLAREGWRTARDGCGQFSLPIKRMHKILHALRDRGLVISREVASDVPQPSNFQPQKEWAVPASVGAFLV